MTGYRGMRPAPALRLPLMLAFVLLAGCAAQPPSGIGTEARLRVAWAAELSNNVSLARAMYAAAATESWNDRAIQLNAAKGLARTGAPADAMAILTEAVRRLPGDREPRRTLASLQIMNGLPARAEQTLTALLAERPEDDGIRTNLGVALDMLHRHAEARALYRAVLARDPGDLETANDLAVSLLLTGDKTGARTVLDPFRGRPDVPERMRTTMTLSEGNADGNADPSVAALSRALKDRGTPVSLSPLPVPRH